MLPDAQRQSLKSLNKHKSIEGRYCRTDVAQKSNARFKNIGNWTERLYGLSPYCAVITRVRLIEHWETVCMLLPVEVAAVNDNSADGGAVPADIFCRRVHRDCCTMLDRLAQDRARGVVHYQRNAE